MIDYFLDADGQWTAFPQGDPPAPDHPDYRPRRPAREAGAPTTGTPIFIDGELAGWWPYGGMWKAFVKEEARCGRSVVYDTEQDRVVIEPTRRA
jgi:hypothetical protein